MPSLPSTPFTDIDGLRVDVDSPVSTDLMTDIVINLNYLKAVVTDGATAPQDIAGKNITANGDLHITGNEQLDGDGQVNGNFNVDGIFSTGVFFSSEQLLFLTGF